MNGLELSLPVGRDPVIPHTTGERRVKLRVLIVDDERNIRTTLALCLEGMGCKVTAVPSREAALGAVERDAFDLVFLDLRLGDESGLKLLPALLEDRPGLAVVMITAYATIETAVEAVRRGALDYLPKPFTPSQVQIIVDQVVRARELKYRVAALEQDLRNVSPEIELETASTRMRGVVDIIERASSSDAPVLLRGENGTGKGVLARRLHARSARAARPFVVVSCPTLSAELLSSELFGHTRGAFTGAVRDQPGRVEVAEGGTLFLDEIAEIPPGLQVKLLRFLQDKEFERIGEGRTRHADVRVVAATNRALESEVAAGRFREDLLYRLNVIEVTIPPLRERVEDVSRLARTFLSFFARQMGRAVPELSARAEEMLLAYDWPGNVRELRNVIERALILWPAQILEPAAFPDRISGSIARGFRLGDDVSLEAIEREHIERVLARAPSLEAAARTLGIDESTLRRKRKRFAVA